MKTAPQASARERILEVSLELFSRQGFAATSMRQIAGQVGIRASSLYNHFESKEAIYAALIDTYGPASSANRLASAAYRVLKDDPAAFCEHYVADLLDQWCDPDEQRFMELMSAERNNITPERQHFLETLYLHEAGAMTGFFRSFALSGRIRAPDAKECARLFMAGLTFIRLEHFLIPSQPSPRRVVREVLNRFLENFLALVAPKAEA